MTRSCHSNHSWRRSWKRIPPFSFWLRNTADIALLFRGTEARNAFGRRHAWWIFAKGCASRTAVADFSAEWFFERARETGSQELRRAVGGNHHVVFAAESEFSGDINAGLVGKSHAGFENGLAASHKIGMLVAVEADAVAQPMSEKFIVRTIAGGGDDRASGIIDGA